MSSARKYKCIFCNKSFERTSLASHIDKHHDDMLCDEKGFTANRIVFDVCNKKEPVGASTGTCRICKKPTEWDEKSVRYKAYCSENCKAQARKNYEKNMLKVYGKTTLLDDMEWQETKMLANRGISGKYRWSDGTYKTYVGSYEKKFLEFCDNVLNIDSGDLLTPGPTIYYEYDGKEHTWITDAIYLPYNLVFDIKDGGDNKNNRDMPEYRAKQLMKEKFITDQGEYNYIRLTNNEFVQLLTIFAELKESYSNEDEPKTISRVHEHTGPCAIGGMAPGITSDIQPSMFISNIMNKNTFETEFALSNDITSEFMIIRDKETGKLKRKKSSELLEDAEVKTFKYIGDDIVNILKEIYTRYTNESYVDCQFLPTLVTEFDEVLSYDQLEFSNLLEYVDKELIQENFNSSLATLQFQTQIVFNEAKPIVFNVLDPVKYEYKKKLLREYEDLTILQSMNGKYFAFNKVSCKRTKGVSSIYEINDSMLKSIASAPY
jgi:endogenous inhibitor of DNA gyrase (YacG/DUF329 family)